MSRRRKAGLFGVLTLIVASGVAAVVFLKSGDKTETFLVTMVIDGDTILLENGESIRYLGIDAPETHHPSRGLECFGPEATDKE